MFGRLAVLSPSAWWDDEAIVCRVTALPVKLPLRIWLDMGTQEGTEALAAVRRLRDAFVAKEWTPGRDLDYAEVRGGRHEEVAWGRRAGKVLRSLFPRRRPVQRRLFGFTLGGEPEEV